MHLFPNMPAFDQVRVVLAALVGTLICGALSACQTSAPYVWVDALKAQNGPPPPYRVQAGDRLNVVVYRQDELSVEATVRPDGRITIPLVGDVAVQGLPPSDAAEQVAAHIKASQLVLEPRVSVTMLSTRAAFVTLLGEVRSPGRYPLESHENLLQILGLGGGLTEFADADRLFVLRQGAGPKGTAQRIRFSYSKLTQGVGAGLDFSLKDGDVIVVEP